MHADSTVSGRRLAVFFGPALLGTAFAPLSPGENHWPLLLLAGALLGGLALLTAVLPWARWSARAQVVPALGMLAGIALLRHGAGGAPSGYSALVLVPVLWLALYGGRVELWLGLAAMVVTLASPIVLLGEPHYPATEWRRLLVYLTVAPFAGIVVQRLTLERGSLLDAVGRLSRTDALTGIANRRGWDEAYGRMVARAAREGTPIAVALLDVDHFKRFNDARGHPAGDRLLKAAAAAWQAQLRPQDVLARYGGEEFAVALEGCRGEDAHAIVERLRAAMPDGETCSAGVATWRPGDSAEALLLRADAALYDAKAAGRNRAVLAEPAPA